MSSINDLSEDLKTGIFPYLNPFDLGNLYQVNTRMRDLILDYIKNITKVNLSTVWSRRKADIYPCVNNSLRFVDIQSICRDIDIEDSEDLEDRRKRKMIGAFRFMTRGATKIVMLNLRNCYWIPLEELENVIYQNPQLKEINLRINEGLEHFRNRKRVRAIGCLH